EVRPHQNRSRGVGRSGQETLGAPEVQVVTDQEIMRSLLASQRHRAAHRRRRKILILSLKERAHGTKPIGTDLPGDAGHKHGSQAFADRVAASGKKCLPGRIAVVLEIQPRATVACLLPLIDVTEPRPKLEHETLDPFVLELREWEDRNILVEVFPVGETAQVVVALGDAGHGKLVAADASRYPDATERPVIPVENDTPARATCVYSQVTGQQIVFHLGADRAGTLPRQAKARRDIAADVHRRQERIQVLKMKMNNPALQNGPHIRSGRILRIAGAETVHIPTHLDLIQAVVDAVIDKWPPPAQHD